MTSKKYLITGSFTFITTLILCFFILILGKKNSFFESKIDLHVFTTSAEGLKVGAKVQLNGIMIGIIDQITITQYNQVKINFKIAKKHRQWIHKKSVVRVKTEGVLGDKYVEIESGHNQEVIDPQGELIFESGTSFAQITNKTDSFIDNGNDVLTTLKKTLVALNQKIENFKIEKTLANVEETSIYLKNTFKNLEDFSNKTNDSFFKVDSSLNRIDNILQRVENGPGTLHSFIYDKSVYEDLQSLLGGASRSKKLQYFIRESIRQSEKQKNHDK